MSNITITFADNIKAGDVVEMNKMQDGKVIGTITLEIAAVRTVKGQMQVKYVGHKTWLDVYYHTSFNVVS